MKTILYIQQRDWILKIKNELGISIRQLALKSSLGPSNLQRFINIHDEKCTWHLSTTTIFKICSTFNLQFPRFGKKI